jgi:hypothetical protein
MPLYPLTYGRKQMQFPKRVPPEYQMMDNVRTRSNAECDTSSSCAFRTDVLFGFLLHDVQCSSGAHIAACMWVLGAVFLGGEQQDA